MKTIFPILVGISLCFTSPTLIAEEKLVIEQQKSNFLYGVKLKNGKFDQPSFRDFVEWVDRELRNNGAEKFGFRRAVLPIGVPMTAKINLVADFREVELGYLLKESDVLLRASWKYEFGVLTFFPYERGKWIHSELQLDSPVLHGIDFGDGDANAVRAAIDERFVSLGARSITVRPDGVKSKWDLENGLLSLSLIESDWEAIYSLDRLMRLGTSIEIARP